MSPGRPRVLGFALAPVGTALAAAIWMAVGLVSAHASVQGSHLARNRFRFSTTGLGLGGATALVDWQIARPDVA